MTAEKDQNSEKNTALVAKKPKQEPTIEVVKDQHGHDRAVARAQTGKFAKRHRAAVLKNMRDVISFFEGKTTDPETGKESKLTRHEQILDKIFRSMMAADADQLVGLSKAYSELTRSAFGSKGKDRILQEADERNNGVKFVIIPPPSLNIPLKQETPVPTKPSWVKDEPAPFIDAEVIEGPEKKG